VEGCEFVAQSGTPSVLEYDSRGEGRKIFGGVLRVIELDVRENGQEREKVVVEGGGKRTSKFLLKSRLKTSGAVGAEK